ncbi:LptF/LptG family permease [Terrimonas ferruginea]|uniref:LptF/LptG family permease n=1 Tax=Terrimonas ferruginea TaxID=249 RepID=UPI0004156828|nr:LptF/LptG family permease [Terrimonas ferruginea]
MKKIDWYILRKLLTAFFFCMLLFTVVAVAVDSSEKTDDFVKTGLSTWDIIKKYYLGFVPWIWGLLFPLFVFIAVIFITSKMAGKSEVIAILASGTSYNRFLRPYIVGGIFLASILWVGSRYLIPKANSIRGEFQTEYIDKNDRSKKNQEVCPDCYFLRIDSNTYVGIKDYDATTHTANRFFLDRTKNNQVVYNLRAYSLKWDTASKKWTAITVTERRVDSIGERITQYPELIVNLQIKPEELIKDEYLKEKLTTPELTKFIARQELRANEGLSALKVERYRRSATAFSVVLLTLIGAVIASRKTRGGSGMHLALGIIIAALFIVSDRFSTVFATKGSFPPLLAAWVPNIAFATVAYWLYRKAPK